MDRNDFDVASIPGARAALQEAYRELRRAEEDHFARAAHKAGEDPDLYMAPRRCPLCRADDSARFLTARGLHLVNCLKCRHVYSRDTYTLEFEKRRYATVGDGTWPAYLRLKEHPVFSQIEQRRNAYYVETCERYSAVGRLLDIGSGNGSFLKEAIRRGWKGSGLDPNPVWQEIQPSMGIRPRLGRFPDDLSPTERYDVIAMLDVLEHMADPVSFLESARRHLSPGGIVFVQVPNLDSLLIRLEGAANNNFCPGHWSYYDAGSLMRLGRMCGFEPVWVETVISELDKVRTFDPERILETAATLAQTPLQDIAELTPEWICANLLGYKLICILRLEASA